MVAEREGVADCDPEYVKFVYTVNSSCCSGSGKLSSLSRHTEQKIQVVKVIR